MNYLQSISIITITKKIECKIAEYSYKIVYKNGESYIHFGCTVHPLDIPYYHYVGLGIGSIDFPESDWNSIPIWRLFDVNEEKNELFSLDYNTLDESTLRSKYSKCKELFLKYCTEFITGNTKEFMVQRSIQNEDREPYKISEVGSNGIRTIRDDPLSLKLKKLFSKKEK